MELFIETVVLFVFVLCLIIYFWCLIWLSFSFVDNFYILITYLYRHLMSLAEITYQLQFLICCLLNWWGGWKIHLFSLCCALKAFMPFSRVQVHACRYAINTMCILKFQCSQAAFLLVIRHLQMQLFTFSFS